MPEDETAKAALNALAFAEVALGRDGERDWN